MDWNVTHKEEQKGLLYKNGTGKKIVGHFKLKLRTFFWGHGECEWPLITNINSFSYLCSYRDESSYFLSGIPSIENKWI